MNQETTAKAVVFLFMFASNVDYNTSMAKIENPDVLTELYINQRMHVRDVAVKLGVGKNTVTRALAKFGITKENRFPEVFTKEQESVLYGSLLGDANLSIQKNGINGCLRMEHSIAQSEWLHWKFNVFKPWINAKNPSLYMSRTNCPSIKFTTVAAPLFTEHYNVFYQDGVKVVNKAILDKVDALALAVWFFDDGSYTESNKQKTMKLATNGFNKFEQEMICAYFHSKWNLDTYIATDRSSANETYHLRFRPESQSRLVEIIRPFCIPSLEYKLDARTKAAY